MNNCFRNIIFLLLLCCSFALENDLSYLKAFDDSIIYRLAWEKEHESLLKEVESLPTVTMVTSRKEKYVCSIPKMLETKEVSSIAISFLFGSVDNCIIHGEYCSQYQLNQTIL
jgi:hypothetical protein